MTADEPARLADYERDWKTTAIGLAEENASLKAELRRLYGQFRLALHNGEELLNDGDVSV